MIGGHRAKARLSLDPSETGGLTAAMPSGTRSLLLDFEVYIEGRPQQVQLGVMITTTDGQELKPGVSDVDAHLHIWSDEALVYATPESRFTVRYGRRVGEGVILQVCDGLDATGSPE